MIPLKIIMVIVFGTCAIIPWDWGPLKLAVRLKILNTVGWVVALILAMAIT